MTTTNPVKEAALEAERCGFSVVPPRGGTINPKAPMGDSWKEAQKRCASIGQIDEWYVNGRDGVGVVLGAVSGNAEAFDFDDASTFDAFVERAKAVGLGDPVERVRRRYEERTPSGGAHWVYRCDEIEGNQKLAQRVDGKVTIETRGEGGYLVTAPTGPSVAGRPYELISGAFSSIPTITPGERRDLLNLARSFDEIPATRAERRRKDREDTKQDKRAGLRPGDDFKARATWHEVLEPHGWTLAYERDGAGYWRRPGKTEGLSASTNYGGDKGDFLYVFSTSTSFDANEAYSKFAAYAVLEHNEDYEAAARALAVRGYGDAPAPNKAGDNLGADFGGMAPKPFDTPLLPDFPLDALGPVLREYVEAVAESVQVDPAAVACAALAALSTALVGRIKVYINSDWQIQPNLYVIIAMESGERKSMIERLVFDAIRKYERELIEASAVPIAQAKLDREVLESSIAKKKTAIANAIAKGGTDGTDAKLAREDAQKLIDEHAHLKEPKPPRITTDNATTEALTSLLSEHMVMALINTEGVMFAMWAGLYSGGQANFDTILKAYEGDAITVDRRSRETEIIDNPLLTIMMMVQPSIVREAGEKRLFRDRGLFARMLIAFPTSLMGFRAPISKAVPEHLRDRWGEVLRGLLALEVKPPVYRAEVRLDSDAVDVFTDYRAKAEAPLAPGGIHEGVKDWAARLPASVIKITCLLHMVEHARDDEDISAETLRRAIAIMGYFTTSAIQAFQTIDQEGEGAAKKLAIKIIEKRDEGKLADGFSTRELYQKVRRHFDNTEEMKNALATVEALGYVTELPMEADSRNKGARYSINPLATLAALRAEQS